MNLAPLPQLLALAALLALLPLAVVWLRARGSSPRARLAALTAITSRATVRREISNSFMKSVLLGREPVSAPSRTIWTMRRMR